eukprot:4050342-Prymnesium_polylepis.2
MLRRQAEAAASAQEASARLKAARNGQKCAMPRKYLHEGHLSVQSHRTCKYKACSESGRLHRTAGGKRLKAGCLQSAAHRPPRSRRRTATTGRSRRWR